MLTGAAFADLLARHGFAFASGVPCSLIEDLIRALEHGAPQLEDPKPLAAGDRLPYVPAVREDVAVGLAAGAWLAGRRPIVLMQNSGLGTSLNALASLSLMYGFPALLVVTWRGHQGKDAPEHILTGAITEPLLDLLGIPHRVLSGASAAGDVAWAAAEMDARSQPVALVVPPGVFAHGGGHREVASATAGGVRLLSSVGEGEGGGHGAAEGAAREGVKPTSGAAPGVVGWGEGRSRHPQTREGETFSHRGQEVAPLTPPGHAELVPRISRFAAIRAAVKQLGAEPVVHANGYPSRESHAVADRPQNFYMIGSMGLASAIGLGIALARPAPATVVFDGDGNLLMNLGILPMVGALRPHHYVHCVFDNEVYGSTGNQRSAAAGVRLDALASAAGYRSATTAVTEDEVAERMGAALASEGAHFVLVKVTPEAADVPRIAHTPTQIRDRFRASLASAPTP